MAVFKRIATLELVVLLVQFLLGNSYLLLPAGASPAACCSDILYPRLALLSRSLLVATAAAAAILLWVRISASSAEAYKKRASLRALLLLAIALSAASSFLVVPTIETGYGYRKGCVCSREPLAVVAMVIMALEHASATFLVAVAQD